MKELLDYDQLRAAVEAKLGLKVVTFSDCQLLESKMADCGAFLSAHTLARFWGLLKPVKRIYTSSILQIVKYLGYESLDAYKRSEGVSLRLLMERELAFSDFSITAAVLTEACLIAGCNDGSLRIFDIDTLIEKSCTPLSKVSIVNVFINKNVLFCLDQRSKMFVLNIY